MRLEWVDNHFSALSSEVAALFLRFALEKDCFPEVMSDQMTL